MIGLAPIGLFDDLDPEDLAELARAGTERWFRRRSRFAAPVKPATKPSSSSTARSPCCTRTAASRMSKGPARCIGELAVLDPAPREATVVASTVAVRALCLTGASLRRALNASPACRKASSESWPAGCDGPSRAHVPASTR